MVGGAHVILYSTDAEADRAFFRDVLGFPSVDAGHGWLIFALPPAEVAIHPAELPSSELYLMCEDLASELDALAAKGVTCSPIEVARWGSISKVLLPGGGEVGLYQPTHPLAIGLAHG
jgi:catechol 2,3-dioxygenase-like lactoylglutathione lyase family enzyme